MIMKHVRNVEVTVRNVSVFKHTAIGPCKNKYKLVTFPSPKPPNFERKNDCGPLAYSHIFNETYPGKINYEKDGVRDVIDHYNHIYDEKASIDDTTSKLSNVKMEETGDSTKEQTDYTKSIPTSILNECKEEKNKCIPKEKEITDDNVVDMVDQTTSKLTVGDTIWGTFQDGPNNFIIC